ncbi:MAG: HD domain-containing protein [Oligoflexia bacterium]|nr:HD domain-containing protein [Oligoflexia bacterium]
MAELFKKPIFDSIHGFINLTKTEDQIIRSAYFQRLRWIKQLGWSHYIFPGATHTRFAHALGAMHVMHKILLAIGKAVPDEKLFDPKVHDAKTTFHRTMRLAALLHDIGTFPFSHSVEYGYINHDRERVRQGKKAIKANHEELGAQIILNTDFDGGITRLLTQGGIDPKELSLIIQGQSESVLSNQLIHSDVDADRMDYLLRDSYHTGVKYGVFELDYLIANMTVVSIDGKEAIAINESALTSLEYFLISRYAWYTQIIREGTGYKFDLLAERISRYFVENNIIYSFDELKKLVAEKPKAFFGFNDSYFTSKLHQALETGMAGNAKIPAQIMEMIEMLMFRIAPQLLRVDPFEPSLVSTPEERQTLVSRIQDAVEYLREKLNGKPNSWILEDIPSKDVSFAEKKDPFKKKTVNHKSGELGLIKILDRENQVRSIEEFSQSLMRILAEYKSFIPRVYMSVQTYDLIQKEGILADLQSKFSTRKNGIKKAQG